MVLTRMPLEHEQKYGVAFSETREQSQPRKVISQRADQFLRKIMLLGADFG